MSEQLNVRLPGLTLDTIDLLCETYGLTKTQCIILAVDRLARGLDPVNEAAELCHRNEIDADLIRLPDEPRAESRRMPGEPDK